MVAQARRIRGRLTGSDAEFEAAERQLRDLGIRFWLAVAQLEHAELALAQGGRADPHALLDEARLTFEQLRARPWLERLAALKAGSFKAAVPDVAG